MASYQHGLHYLLDTQIPQGLSAFSWSTHIPRVINLREANTGRLAWLEGNICGSERTYVPLFWKGIKENSGNYELGITSYKRLDSYFVNLNKTDSSGKFKRKILSNSRIQKATYYRGQLIRFALPRKLSNGCYVVEVGAIDRHRYLYPRRMRFYISRGEK